MSWLLAICTIWFYTLICGLPISAIRSSILFSVLGLCRCFGGKSLSLNGLLIAFACILIWKPYELFALGFQLSFIATFALIWTAPSIMQKPSTRIGIRLFKIRGFAFIYSLTFIGLMATLATTPFLLSQIHQVSPFGIIAGIAGVPLATGILFSNLLLFLFSPLSNTLTELCATFSSTLLKLLDFVSSLFSQWYIPKIYGSLSHPLESIFYWGLILIFPFCIKKSGLKIWLFCLTFLLSSVHLITSMQPFMQKSMQLKSFYVGQGDAYLLQWDGITGLIDVGTGKKSFTNGPNVILPYLKKSGIQKLDFVLITHTDEDHMGGLKELTKRLAIKHLFLPENYDTLHFQKSIIRKMNIHTIKCGDIIIQSKHAQLIALNPCPQMETRQNKRRKKLNRNNNSLVAKWMPRTGDNPLKTGVLFAADIDSTVEKQLIKRWGPFLDSDILKLSHHGSKHSSCSSFLKSVSPEWSLISAGSKNSYKHPHQETLSRLNSHNLNWINTGISGQISCKTMLDGPIEFKCSSFKKTMPQEKYMPLNPVQIAESN